jgi:hypothetical protein
MLALLISWAVLSLVVLRWFHAVSTKRRWIDEHFTELIRSKPPVIRTRLNSSPT